MRCNFAGYHGKKKAYTNLAHVGPAGTGGRWASIHGHYADDDNDGIMAIIDACFSSPVSLRESFPITNLINVCLQTFLEGS